MTRRSEQQARVDILAAAEAEFIRLGATGARIDRIAKDAGASKERLYAYFGGKQGLFDEVISGAFERFEAAVRVQNDDLVEYAGDLVEHFGARPDDLRLLAWTKLDEQCERAFEVTAVQANHADKVAAITRAQAAGSIDPTWDPDELLKLILACATYWATASVTAISVETVARHRATAEEVVRRMIQPRAR
ncbi:TetR family transcriptional regulator [Herbiconiux liangxiaofengii]|uniref:TetR family transcriptional regulator n=1 Tax=Herbiconiux liangxiaofengii TaxID=3342795 RepID=UPI0035BB6F72